MLQYGERGEALVYSSTRGGTLVCAPWPGNRATEVAIGDETGAEVPAVLQAIQP